MLQQRLHHLHVPVLTGSQQGRAPILQSGNALERVQAHVYQADAPYRGRALEKTFPIDNNKLTFPFSSCSLYIHDKIPPKGIMLYMWMTRLGYITVTGQCYCE